MMQKINQAYDVLRDPQKRSQYDKELFGSAFGADQEAQAADIAEAEELYWDATVLGYEVCGARDADVRLTASLWVLSLLILSFRRASVGIWCPRHRRGVALRNIVISLLFGLWGIPWGPLWVVQALFENLTGGRQPEEPNAALLKNIAAYQIRKSDYEGAALALADSLKFEYDQASAKVLGAILQAHPDCAYVLDEARGKLGF